MVYRDEPSNDGGEGGAVEMPSTYHDDATSPSHDEDGEYGISVQSMRSNGNSSSLCKVLLGVCFVASLLIGGRELYSYGAHQGQAGGEGSNSLSEPQASEAEEGKKKVFPNKAGIRGSSNDEPDEEESTVVESTNNEKKKKKKPQSKPVEPNPNKEEVPLPEIKPAVVVKPKDERTPSKSKPKPSNICEDDATFVHTNLHTCSDWIERVGRPMLHQGRCHQTTGIFDDNGDELQIRHFCRKSCGLCGDSKWAEMEKQSEQNEYVQELSAGNTAEEVKEQDEEEAEKEEFAEEIEDLDEENKVEDIEEEMGIDKVELEKEEEVTDTELWEELKEEENEAEESVSDGKTATVPHASKSEDESFDANKAGGNPLEPDYFVPLTNLERVAMKEKLLRTLKDTKDALIMSSTLASLPESTKEAMVVATERTLALDPKTPKLFMHLQHNMTGSESIDDLITCAIDRQNEMHTGDKKDAISQSSINECDNLDQCMNDLASLLGAVLVDNEFTYVDDEGKPISGAQFNPADPKLKIPDESRNACGASESNVMNYCTSFGNVKTFGWESIDSIAMFANPVERTHRYYMLMAEECYNCEEMNVVMKKIKTKGIFQANDGHYVGKDIPDACTYQMIGHQATNLLSNPYLLKVANDVNFPKDEEIVDEAVRNLREQITWVGLLDRLDESVVAFKEVWPWLGDNLIGASERLNQWFAKRGERVGEDMRFGLPPGYIDKNSCLFTPKDDDLYTCGTREVDEEALYWIKQLNMRDLAVYKAAVERFEIQQEVLKEYRSQVWS